MLLGRMDTMRIFRLWAQAAWADNELHPAESAALQRFLDNSEDLNSEERNQARQLLRSAPDNDVTEVRKLSEAAREGVYRAALGIVQLDRKVVDAERDFLTRLRMVLDLDEKTIARIRAEG